eukprot:3739316-Rhodomonas_salina.1
MGERRQGRAVLSPSLPLSLPSSLFLSSSVPPFLPSSLPPFLPSSLPQAVVVHNVGEGRG